MVAVCLLIAGLDAWRTWAARMTEIADQQVGTANLARSLAQHAHDMLDKADTLLVSLRETIETEGHGPAVRPRLQRLMSIQIATVPTLRDLMVFDAHADRLVNSGRPAPVVENVGDRAYFQYHLLNQDRGIHIGSPVHGKLDGTLIVTLSRRIDTPDGGFGGVVVATFAIKSIRDFYGTFDVGREGFIGLNTLDGVIITRFPGDEADVGRNISSGGIYNERLRTQGMGDWISVSPVDGIEHLGSYRRVESYPLVVVVGVGLDEVLTPWRTDALIHLAVSLLASAVIAILGGRFVLQLRLKQATDIDLQRRERQFRLLADNNTDLIVQFGRNLILLYASPASQGMLGYAPEDMLGRGLGVFVHADDWQALRTGLSAITEACPVLRVSYRARRQDGTDCWVEAAGRRLDGGGDIILIQRDITERRDAEMKLRAAQRMEAVGQLTAGVAHDFNNLLQAQLGALELLGRHSGNVPKVEHFAGMALHAAQHAAKLTQSLLSFSRQQVLDPEAVPVAGLLGRLEVILSRTLGPRIALGCEIAADLAPVLADPAHLEAALLNLAINARDAMPDGGCLSIQACNARDAFGCPEALDPEQSVLIAVSDNGTGMDADTLARACDPFYTTKAVGKGSGLGLSMVQGFAQQSGGALRFSSSLGHGTRAELWLPRAVVDTPRLAVDAGRRASGQGRVLLVDDVAEISLVMTEILEGAGFSVVPAVSGEAALAETLRGERFDAIVTDYAMPGIDGLELILQARRSNPVLPAIILTGYADTHSMLDLPAGVAILQKPVGGCDLVGRIRDLIDGQALEATAMPGGS